MFCYKTYENLLFIIKTMDINVNFSKIYCKEERKRVKYKKKYIGERK
jgi:hypothetical protein